MLIKSFNQTAGGGAGSKPFPGDLRMGLFLTAGDFYTDLDGWLWVVPNGKKLANSSGANDELHLTDGEATYNDPVLRAIFAHLWELGVFSVTPSRGASALDDWGNGRRLILPDWRGRSPMMAGEGVGLTARGLGQTLGNEAIALTESQIPSHSHSMGTAGEHSHLVHYASLAQTGSSTVRLTNPLAQNPTASTSVAGNHTHPLSATGGGGSHPNIHPVFTCSVLLATGEKNPL